MKPTMMFIFIGSLLTAVGRFLVPGHSLSSSGSYEAFAHIFVGYLLAICISPRDPKYRWPAIMCLVAITILEIAMFMIFKRSLR